MKPSLTFLVLALLMVTINAAAQAASSPGPRTIYFLFFLVALVFVYRSFYAMRIPDEAGSK